MLLLTASTCDASSPKEFLIVNLKSFRIVNKKTRKTQWETLSEVKLVAALSGSEQAVVSVATEKSSMRAVQMNYAFMLRMSEDLPELRRHP